MDEWRTRLRARPAPDSSPSGSPAHRTTHPLQLVPDHRGGDAQALETPDGASRHRASAEQQVLDAEVLVAEADGLARNDCSSVARGSA